MLMATNPTYLVAFSTDRNIEDGSWFFHFDNGCHYVTSDVEWKVKVCKP